MGALLFTNETYRETLPIIDVSGVSAIPFGISDKKNWLYDPKSGSVQKSEISLSDLAKNSDFQAEINRYIDFWKNKFEPLTVVGYKVRFSTVRVTKSPRSIFLV